MLELVKQDSMLSMIRAQKEKKEMTLVMEKTEVLKVEREMILLKETMENMTTCGQKSLIKMMELVVKKKWKIANPQNYQGNGDRENKYQKDEGAERNDSADGNNRNGDEDYGGGEEVGVEEGEKEKIPNDEGSDQDDRACDEKNGDNDSPPPPPPSHAFDKLGLCTRSQLQLA